MRLPETITIWTPTGNDGFGGIGYSGPTVVSARHADKIEKFTDANGDQQISKAVVYSRSTALRAGAVVYLGESVSPLPVPGSDDVRAVVSIPSGTSMVKAWL